MSGGRRRSAQLAAQRAAETDRLAKKRAQEMLRRRVKVREDLLRPTNSHGTPEFVLRGHYVDYPFKCKDCGVDQIWRDTQQKWWYETAKGDVWTVAVRCRSCRRRERERKAAARTCKRGGMGAKQHNEAGSRMARSDDVNTLPDGLPIPTDDGACNHLKGMVLPELELRATNGRAVDLAALRGRTVVYVYPRTGRPDQEPPSGWNDIPGARGCTPQSCSFRDHKTELESLGAKLFGLSTQDSDYQQEALQRLHLPFELLSDCDLALTDALRLPTFKVDGMRLIKRVTLVLHDGRIEKVFYPVFPPDRNAEEVIAWLKANPAHA